MALDYLPDEKASPSSPDDKHTMVDLERDAPCSRFYTGVKMNRIDGGITSTTKAVNSSDSDLSMSVESQMKAEEGNSIKYRSCSWQKVCSSPPQLSASTQADPHTHRLQACSSPSTFVSPSCRFPTPTVC